MTVSDSKTNLTKYAILVMILRQSIRNAIGSNGSSARTYQAEIVKFSTNHFPADLFQCTFIYGVKPNAEVKRFTDVAKGQIY